MEREIMIALATQGEEGSSSAWQQLSCNVTERREKKQTKKNKHVVFQLAAKQRVKIQKGGCTGMHAATTPSFYK